MSERNQMWRCFFVFSVWSFHWYCLCVYVCVIYTKIDSLFNKTADKSKPLNSQIPRVQSHLVTKMMHMKENSRMKKKRPTEIVLISAHNYFLLKYLTNWECISEAIQTISPSSLRCNDTVLSINDYIKRVECNAWDYMKWAMHRWKIQMTRH